MMVAVPVRLPQAHRVSRHRQGHPAHRLGDELGRRADVEPDEAGALLAEVASRAQRDPAALQEGGGGVVPQPEGAAVQPGEEGGRPWDVADAGQLRAQLPGEHRAVLIDLGDDRVEPVLGLRERGHRGKQAQMRAQQRLPPLGEHSSRPALTRQRRPRTSGPRCSSPWTPS